MILLLLIMFVLPFMIFATPVFIMLLCMIGWLMIAFSAPYVIAYLRLSWMAGMRSTRVAMIGGFACGGVAVLKALLER